MPVGEPKEYLEYLDKEMTIMGILSTFCVAAAALVIERVGTAEHESLFRTLLQDHPLSVFVGSGFLMAAGLCFYLQRSRLAHFYGSICMSMTQPGYHDWDTSRWLLEAYSWRTWLRYRAGFSFLMATSVLYVHAIYRTMYPHMWPLHWLVWLALLLIFLDALVRAYILLSFRSQPNPYRAFWHVCVRRDWLRCPDPPRKSDLHHTRRWHH